MSRKDKLIARLKSKPKDFEYSELTALFKYLGYKEKTSGKTSGSRVTFFNETTRRIIKIHKPHPQPNLKEYVINELLEALKDELK